jgi:sporulation protein YunB
MSSRFNFSAAFALVIIIGVIISFVYVDFRLKSAILEIAKSRAQVMQSEKISQIVNEQVVAQINYQDIVDIHKDNQGRIVLIQPNTIILNKIMTNTVTEVSASLNAMEEQSLAIPLGEVTGSKILAGYGPRMKVRIIPAGQVHVSVLNKFDQAGINQTRHLIYFNIENTIKVAVPFLDE